MPPLQFPAVAPRDPSRVFGEGTAGEGPTNGLPMGSEHSRRDFQNIIQELRIRANPPFFIEKENSANIVRLKIFNDERHAPILGAYALEIGAGPNGPAVNDAPEPIKEVTESGGQQGAHSGSSFITVQAINRGGKNSISRILQPDNYDPEEYWRPQASSRPKIVFQMCRGKKIQDGDPDVDMPYDPPKRLYDFPGFGGCIHSHPYPQAVHEMSQILVELQEITVPGASIWAVAKSSHFYQGSQTGPDMGTRSGNQSLFVSRRLTNTCGIEGGMHLQHELGLLQSNQAGVSKSKVRDLRRKVQKVAERSKNNVLAPGELHRKGTGYVGCTLTGSPDSEEALGIEEQFAVEAEMLGVAVILTEPVIQNLRFWRDQLMTWNGQSFLPETPEMDIYTESRDKEWGIVVGSNKYSGVSRPCPEQAHIPKQIFYIQGYLRSPELFIQTHRRGPIRLTPEPEGGSILQLIPRNQRQRDECTGLQLVRMVVEICDLVPRPERIVSEPAAIVTGDVGSKRSPKRKITTHRYQALELDGIADQRHALQEQGLSILPFLLSFPTNDVSSVDPGTIMYNIDL
ncbi:hypothetical protein AYI69_g8082 [Smittium culicis]|uniref:Uncharacterized protein n=1 Tax=Smittium culicis TaxID=133412 RepID=A0A1R1XMA1_9FUNG|nr:hypothetical protein AYI69_g8082 [Smittium culicis]